MLNACLHKPTNTMNRFKWLQCRTSREFKCSIWCQLVLLRKQPVHLDRMTEHLRQTTPCNWVLEALAAECSMDLIIIVDVLCVGRGSRRSSRTPAFKQQCKGIGSRMMGKYISVKSHGSPLLLVASTSCLGSRQTSR